MKRITVLTLFPEIVLPYLNHSVLKQAQSKEKVIFSVVNFRDYASDKHKSVDDHPFGGGAGMLLRVDTLVAAIEDVESKFGPAHKVLLSPQGKLWSQPLAEEFQTKNDHLLFICGHYEGYDERIYNYIDEEISLGRFVLSGGEVAALAVVDSIVRLIPGVLKKPEATSEETFMMVNKQELFKATKDQELLANDQEKIELLEYPQYTHPVEFRGKKVPEILLSGNHAKIREWRLQEAWKKTQKVKN